MKKTLTAILIVLISTNLLAQAPPSYVPANGLIAWYPFNGNPNDESGNGNNGTITGATLTSDRLGNINKAYTFNGISDYIDIPVQQMNVTNYSISCWFNYSSIGVAGRYRGIVQASGISGYSLSIQLSGDPTFPAPNKLSVSINGPGVFNGWITQDTFNTDIWHHVVAVITATTGSQTNSSQISFYLDGVLINSISNPIDYSSVSVPYNGSGNTKIGRTEHCCTNTSNFFNGKIDDVGIWNRALTQQEITDLYLAKTCTITPITNNITITGCDSINHKGNVYHNSTTLADTIKSNAGCDSIYNKTQISILNSAKSYAYIFNNNSYPANGVLSKINTLNDSIEATISLGFYADSLVGITTVPNKSKVYLSNYYQGKIYVVNTLTNIIDTIISLTGSFQHPYNICSSSDGSKVFFTNAYDSTITILNTTTNAITAIIPISGGFPLKSICNSPNGSKIYATQNSNVYSIDIATNNISATIPITGDPYGICTNHDGSKIFVGDRLNNSIVIINATTNNIVTTIPVGQYPKGLCTNVDGSKLYVANNNSNSVSVINTNTNTVIKNINVNGSPFGVSVTGDGTKLFVGLGYNSNCDNTKTIVIDALTDTIIKSIKLDSSCYGATSIGNFIASSNIKRTDTINLIGCDSVTHNGKIYKTSTIIYDTLKNGLACDSAYNIVNVKIKPSSASSTNITISQVNLPYVWNGLTFTGSGTQTAHLTNGMGCDSAATLNLTVLLPLNFINFSAAYINTNSTVLSWATANEINVLNYIVEFSLNGMGFETIVVVSAKNGVRNSYIFTHTLPKLTNNQIFYYRIKGVDKDGKITYSEVKTVKYENSNLGDFVLAPNPAHEMIEVYSSNSNALIVISDIYGKQLKTVLVKNNLSRLDISSLPKGIYFVSLSNDKNKATKKLIVE